MSVMAELDMLSYDIEQLWIEGRNPVQIAGEIDCHVDLVHCWIELNAEYLDLQALENSVDFN